jgi:4-coumarate--CoA ligase
VLAVGATISPIPVQQGLDAQAIAPRLQQAETKLIITDRKLSQISRDAARLAGDIPLINLDGPDSGIPGILDLLPEGNPTFANFRLNSYEETEKYNAFVYRTSGSSGNIKSVNTPHAHWAANLLTTKLTVPANTDPSKDVWISSLPFAYGINAKLNLGLNVLLGIPVIILKRAFDQSTLPLIDKYGISFLFVTPPLAAQIAKSEKREGAYKSIKWLLSAGAPVHPKIRDGVQERFNGTRLTLEWGTTETLLIALQVDQASSVPGTSGTLVNGLEAKVIDLETGIELGPNQQGELLVRNSLCRFAGYKDNEEANRDFDEDGWFHSGDVGFIDHNSNVFIVDRLKELLRVGDGYGTHVSTGEIEAALFDHPAVSTAVVVGIRDQDTQQEHPTAFIVPQKEFKEQTSPALAEEIEKFVEVKLGYFKRVSGGVYFLEKYPHIGYKINKRLLKGLVDVGTNDRTQRLISVGA